MRAKQCVKQPTLIMKLTEEMRREGMLRPLPCRTLMHHRLLYEAASLSAVVALLILVLRMAERMLLDGIAS